MLNCKTNSRRACPENHFVILIVLVAKGREDTESVKDVFFPPFGGGMMLKLLNIIQTIQCNFHNIAFSINPLMFYPFRVTRALEPSPTDFGQL